MKVGLILLGVFSVVLGGCALNRQYRTDNPEPSYVTGSPAPRFSDRKTASERDDGLLVVPSADGKDAAHLATIEFDEQGDFWDEKQLFNTLKAIRESDRRGILLITYIHGWQNNASAGSRDAIQFRTALQTLVDSPTIRGTGLQVFGVFIGWRGSEWRNNQDNAFEKTLGLLASGGKALSYWGRRNTTDRISGPPLTKTLFALTREARLERKFSRSIVVGHSFGGRILEKAVGQAILGHMLASGTEPGAASGERHTYRPPFDLVLLVNPASESLRAHEIIHAFREYEFGGSGHPDGAGISFDQPLVISITSQGDVANGIAFPVGQSTGSVLGVATGEYRFYEHGVWQWPFNTLSSGFKGSIRSHVIARLDHPPAEGQRCSRDGCFETNLRPGADRLVFATRGATNCDPNWWRINPIENPNNHTPYWVLQAPREIIKGHGDIFSGPSLDLMAALFRVSAMARNVGAPRSGSLLARPKESPIQPAKPPAAGPTLRAKTRQP